MNGNPLTDLTTSVESAVSDSLSQSGSQAAQDYLYQKAVEAYANPVVWGIVFALGFVIIGQMLPKGKRA